MMLRCLGLDAGPAHLSDGRLAGTCTIYGEGQLVVEYLAVAMEGGRTGLIKATDRFRRQ